MLPVFVKRASEDDIKSFEKIRFEAEIFMSDNKIKGFGEDADLAPVFKNAINENSLFAITDYKDKPVGCVIFSLVEGQPKAVCISYMIIDRHHRGQGVSSLIFKHAERYAQKNGASVLRAEADASNFVMRAALVRFGFKQVRGENDILSYEKAVDS